MKTYVVLPVAAATAWAQQATPGEAEKALRAQVDRYYQLIQEKKFREAEKLVAEESKEDYYNGKKPDIRGFVVLGVQMTDESHAVVTVKAKQPIFMMGAGVQIFEIPSPTHWKLEDGEWRWYVPESAKGVSPFGKLSAGNADAGQKLDTAGAAPGGIKAPDIGAIQNQLKADRSEVSFAAGADEQTVAITNSLPGPVDLTLDPHVRMIRGLKADLGSSHLEAGGRTTLRLRRIGTGEFRDEVVVLASPLNLILRIQVEGKK